ncbi:hypothetical protein CSC94_22905 [Zhengella mangrovi]|uniref:Acyltransferase 3 domain-containing protein n=1 Tax=Zhengella mangrovi TaxID=1982044 RepID=A0A2G1QGT5_9HYPH|nr:TraX family protein [Zhengella mangrovi]PHP64726.1 hypothetical protein CSC94_22905 [Zhengella mangrovi]
METATRTASARPAVDNTDWLKTAAIIFVAIDHFGYYFMESDLWWSVLGRFAAPVFFFLLGYGRSTRVPALWIVAGIVLTVLDSAGNGWTWVAPNILLSFALIRWMRPLVVKLLVRHDALALAVIATALVAAAPFAGPMIEYGTSGWLWALFGLLQRLHADADPGLAPVSTLAPVRFGLVALAAAVFLWREQAAYGFPDPAFITFLVEMVLLVVVLYLYRRGPSALQPPVPASSVLRFVGRHTFDLYVLQLLASEALVALVPGLAP